MLYYYRGETVNLTVYLHETCQTQPCVTGIRVGVCAGREVPPSLWSRLDHCQVGLCSYTSFASHLHNAVHTLSLVSSSAAICVSHGHLVASAILLS